MPDTGQEDSPTLDYRGPHRGADSWRAAVVLTGSGLLVCLAATAWWQVGIRVGQRVEGQTVLFEPATGTPFWDRVVILPPMMLLAGGFLGLASWCLANVSRGRWGTRALAALPVVLALAVVTLVVNFPLIDAASP